MESKAEDTLKTLRSSKGTSGCMRLHESCAEIHLDGSDSEDSVVSGPSSPSAALHLRRCGKCEGLFAKTKTQGPPRKKQRDDDPASLSCDEWLLNKTWQPQRRQQSRGRLWVHLKRIRLQAAKQSDNGMANKAWSLCSRPHVFLQRNLRHCKKMFGKPSKSKAKPVRQRRDRAKSARPLYNGKHQRRKKRKSDEKDGTPEQLSPLDLSTTFKDELPANDDTHHEDLQQFPEKVPKKQSVSDVSSFLEMQPNGSGLEGTRRVLKFDTETQNPKQRLVHESSGAKLHEGQVDFTAKNGDGPGNLDDVPCEDLDVFRTPVDPFTTDLKITRKSRPSRPRTNTFRSMLAAFGHGHNQIIKESHH